MTRDFQDKPTIRTRGHSVSIENRERAVFTGVQDVDSFNEQEVILVSEAGVIALIGQDLHISRLTLDEGQLVVEGQIDAIEYTEGAPAQRKGFLGKLFK